MLIGACLGIILGIILGYVGSKLSLQDTFLMIIALFVAVIVIALILIDDVDAKIKKSILQRKKGCAFVTTSKLQMCSKERLGLSP